MAGGERVVGIDVARGLAILGMMAVHILDPGPFPWVGWMPDNWDQTARGRSAILFAVIAGIAIAIMSGRERPYSGVSLLQARVRILVRGVVIFAVGGVLATVPHNIAVILEVYGVLFALALPFLSVPSRVLFPLLVAMGVTLPPVLFVLQNLVARDEFGQASTFVRLFVTGSYPALVWIIYVVLGMAVGRLDLASSGVQLKLFAAGCALAILGHGAGRWAERTFDLEQPVRGEDVGRFDLSRMGKMEPHGETWFEVFGSSGIALVVLVTCIILAPHLRVLVYPLAAAGSMALTVYVAHVVSMHWIWQRLDLDNQYQVYLATVGIVLLATTLWKLLIGQGPLEWALSWLSWRAARV